MFTFAQANPSVFHANDRLVARLRPDTVYWSQVGLVLWLPTYVSSAVSDSMALWYGPVIAQARLRRRPMKLDTEAWACHTTDCPVIDVKLVDTTNHMVVGSITTGYMAGAQRVLRLLPCNHSFYLELDIFDVRPYAREAITIANRARLTGAASCVGAQALDEMVGSVRQRD